MNFLPIYKNLEKSSEMLRSKNESAFRKENNKFGEKSKEAIIVRKGASELKKEIEKLNNKIKENEKIRKIKEQLSIPSWLFLKRKVHSKKFG